MCEVVEIDSCLYMYKTSDQTGEQLSVEAFFLRDFTNVLKTYHVNTHIQTWNYWNV